LKKFIFDYSKFSKNIVSDVVILGSGAAGLFAALNLKESLDVIIIAKGDYTNSNSYLAQGGIAAVTDKEKDSFSSHIEDTLRCGGYRNRKSAVSYLVENGQIIIKDLIDIGVPFDRDESGNLLLAKEGAHSARRIARVSDYTGKSIMESLNYSVESRENIKNFKNSFAIDILTYNDRAVGVSAILDGVACNIFSDIVIIATGGYGNVFPITTNQPGITGDGQSMFVRSGGKLLEENWVQFHPTAFYDGNDKKQKFLVSEAVRGEGAILRNHAGNSFMNDRHVMKDLAPRNFVTREIMKEMKNEGKKNIFLDATMFKKGYFEKRFPTIHNHCMKNGIDPSKDYIPVAPCAHYVMGGIPVTLKGKTVIKGIYACGECSRTGVHGNNRLASNSLLEALVFSKNLAKSINDSHMGEHKKTKKIDERTLICKDDIFNWKDSKTIKLFVEKISYEFLNELLEVVK